MRDWNTYSSSLLSLTVKVNAGDLDKFGECREFMHKLPSGPFGYGNVEVIDLSLSHLSVRELLCGCSSKLSFIIVRTNNYDVTFLVVQMISASLLHT